MYDFVSHVSHVHRLLLSEEKKIKDMKFREKIREMTGESRECNIQITVGEKEVNASQRIIIPLKGKLHF